MPFRAPVRVVIRLPMRLLLDFSSRSNFRSAWVRAEPLASRARIWVLTALPWRVSCWISRLSCCGRLPGQGTVFFLQAASLFFEHLLRQLIDSFGRGRNLLSLWPQGFHHFPVQGAFMPEPTDLLIPGNLPVQASFFPAHGRKICTKLGLLGSGTLVGRLTGKRKKRLLRFQNLGFQFPAATDGIIAVGGQLGAGHGPGGTIQEAAGLE